MTKKEYLNSIANCKVINEKVAKIEKVYMNKIPEIIKKLISYSEQSIFFDDGYRSLSFSEIIDAEEDLHVDFVKQGIIPIIDCGENDFIVYHFNGNNWSLFNIVDECAFKERASLDELLIKK